MSGSGKKEFKIKVLPKPSVGDGEVRSNAVPKRPAGRVKTKSSRKKSSTKESSNFKFVFLGLALVSLGGLYVVNSNRPQTSGAGSSPIASEDRKLNNYLQEAQKKAELQNLEVQVENHRATEGEELPAFLPLNSEDHSEKRPLGVELDADPAIDRVYKDLALSPTEGKWMSPEERVTMRLAERKWLYEFEKEERKAYIRSFIDAAKTAGYQIKINEDLIVTEVKPLTSKPTIPLDKVIENLTYPR